MTVTEATQASLALIFERAPALESSFLAASALALARELDDPGNSATSKSLLSKELRETMAVLESIAPAKAEKDGVDELSSRRAKRRSRTAC